mmetsp:Transcript_11340/g.26757  ORF Transcript_11340/g.26757 Transcript_11340/m.26757 type:complete len:149 (-) Transcript_11340:17-463(-)
MRSQLLPSARGENAARAALVVFVATARSAETRRQETAKSAGLFSPGGAAALQCLGGVEEDYTADQELEPAWSPGCEKCWDDPKGCEAHVRGVDRGLTKSDWTKDLMFYGVITLAIIAGGLSLLLLVNACRKPAARATGNTVGFEMRAA